MDSAVSQDACEDGEGRDRHRYPDEQRETREGYARGRESWVEKYRERRTHQKRSEDAGVRDSDGCVPAVAQQLGIKFESDEKHVQDDADLCDHVKKWRNQ